MKEETVDPFAKELGDRIRKARRGKLFTQAWLARKAGLSPLAIGNYENGRVLPRLSALMKLSNALGVSVAYFAGESPALCDVEDVLKPEHHGRAVYPGSWPTTGNKD